MKTLDEVIKAFECCDHGEPDSRCEDCPYNGIGVCCLERENDGIHYLKEYQRYQNTPSCNGHMSLVDYFEASQKNEPLAWDELRSMEDKPVWWTHGEAGEWLTIYGVPKNDNNVIYATTCSGVECWIYKKDMDKYNYYKKELE